jgi:hypothetical protein
MIASEFIRVKRSREEIQAFLQDPQLPERILKMLEKQFSISIGVSGVIAGQSVATAIDELLGLTSNLQYADVDLFLPAPAFNSSSPILHNQSNVEMLKRSFALKHFHAWVNRVFCRLDNARLALAKQDPVILQEFIHDVSAPENNSACLALKSLSGSRHYNESITPMRGLLVLENQGSAEFQGYPSTFQAANDFIGTCTYRIVGIQNEGVEQRIYYHGHESYLSSSATAYAPGQGSSGYNIVSGFDLNSVSVGVNLREGKMIYTPAYVDFLLNRQIHILQSKTPVQSVVRAMKKAQEHAGFFKSAHGLEVMRHTLLFLGTEPLGLNMPDSYEPGAIYKLYGKHRSATITGNENVPSSSSYINFIHATFKDRAQARFMIKRAFDMFVSKHRGSIITTSSRLAQLSDENRELLQTMVQFHYDPTGAYVFPEVINFENIQYDCLLQQESEYSHTSGSNDAIAKHAAFPGEHTTIWQNIDWGMRFKKFRPAYIQRIKKLFTPISQYLPEELSDYKVYARQSESQPKSYLPLVSLLYDSPTTLLYEAMKGRLSEKTIKISEMPAKTIYNTMVARTHHLVRQQLLQHWCKVSNPISQTVDEHAEYVSFIHRFIEKFNEAEHIYCQAAKILDISERRLPRATSLFPKIQILWENIHDDQGRDLASRVQRYFNSGATKEGMLTFEGFTVDSTSCFPFFNKMENFEKALRNNIKGWALLERFFDVWIGVGFTTLLREASSNASEYLKKSFIDFKSFYADGVKAQWKKQCQEKGLIVTNLSVEELIRADDLVQEGIEMHHCVGGYGTHVSQERSFIIKYRATVVTLETCPSNFVGPGAPTTHTLKATAEWRNPSVQPVGEAFENDDKTYTYDLSQIRDVYNSTPHAELRALDTLLRSKGLPNAQVKLPVEEHIDAKVQKITTYTMGQAHNPYEDEEDIPF